MSATLKLYVTREGGVRFEVRAKPNARKNHVGGVHEGALVVHVAAPPADGAANAGLVALIARTLGLAMRDVAIVRGQRARSKVIEVRGLAPELVQQRLVSDPR